MASSINQKRITAALHFLQHRMQLFIFLLVSLHVLAFGQVSQIQRFELEHKNSDHDFIIINMGAQGIALVRDLEKFENDKKVWETIFVDSTLHESWRATIEVGTRMNILGHEFRDGNIYLIFSDQESTKVQLTEIHSASKLMASHLFKPQVAMQYTQFIVVKNKAVFGGYISKEPALILYDLANESTKVVPGLFQSHGELLDLRANSNDTFNAVVTERQSNASRKMVIRTYDANGVILVDDAIAIDEGKSILTAITSTLVHDELMIMGTWTYGSNRSAAGIFSVGVDPFSDQKINFYDFPSLNHFLDYMKPKRMARVKAKADSRRKVNKNIEFRVHTLPVRIEETNEGFCLLAEVYDPPTQSGSRTANPYSNTGYNPYAYSPYGFNSMPYRYYGNPYGYNPYAPTGNYYSFAETRMMHSSLLFFDNHGQLTGDNGLKFPEIKLSTKEQVSDFVLYNNRVTMAVKNEKEFLVSQSQPDGTFKEEKFLVALQSNTESIKSESNDDGRLRTWYGRYFFIYGHHSIKDNSEKGSRNVFYINKVKVD